MAGNYSAAQMRANRSDKGILLDVGTNEVEFLEFGVGDQRYAVNVAKVHQVVPWAGLQCQPVPLTSPGVLGTVLYRDEFLKAFDLRALLGLGGPEAPHDRKLMIITHFNAKSYGFQVDCIHGIERVSWANFVPMDGGSAFQGESAIVGTVRFEDRIVHTIDFEAIMAKLDPSQSVEAYGQRVTTNKELDRSKVHVLYCEDSATVRRVAMAVLKGAGYTNVVTKNTGLDGLEYLNSPEGKGVDILLSDIEMPEMDGLTLCKTVKSNPETANIPVIFFSSLISEQMKLKCEEVHADACFTKPEIDRVVPCLDEIYQSSSRK